MAKKLLPEKYQSELDKKLAQLNVQLGAGFFEDLYLAVRCSGKGADLVQWLCEQKGVAPETTEKFSDARPKGGDVTECCMVDCDCEAIDIGPVKVNGLARQSYEVYGCPVVRPLNETTVTLGGKLGKVTVEWPDAEACKAALNKLQS